MNFQYCRERQLVWKCVMKINLYCFVNQINGSSVKYCNKFSLHQVIKHSVITIKVADAEVKYTCHDFVNRTCLFLKILEVL